MGRLDKYDHEESPPDRGNTPFIVLLVMIVLALGGWYVVNRIWSASTMQDCVQAGHRNCVPVDQTQSR